MKHLINTVDGLRQNVIGFKVLSGAGAEIYRTTPNGRLYFGIFVALAEFERELIMELTEAEFAAGRPRKMTRVILHMAITAMANPALIGADAPKPLGITMTTYVNGDGSLKEPW